MCIPIELEQNYPNLDAPSRDSESEIQVIYSYRTTKLSYTEIALKLDFNEQFARTCIDQYKKMYESDSRLANIEQVLRKLR